MSSGKQPPSRVEIDNPASGIDNEALENEEGSIEEAEMLEPAEVGLNVNSGQAAGIDERLPRIDRRGAR